MEKSRSFCQVVLRRLWDSRGLWVISRSEMLTNDLIESITDDYTESMKTVRSNCLCFSALLRIAVCRSETAVSSAGHRRLRPHPAAGVCPTRCAQRAGMAAA